MASAFSTAQANLAFGTYERAWYNYGPASLGSGAQSIFNAYNWQSGWQAKVSGLQATQNAKVQMQITADKDQYLGGTQGYTDAMPANLQTQTLDAKAIQTLILGYNNTNASGPSSFNINYRMDMQRLTIAEKMALPNFNSGMLTAQEQQILAGLTPSGKFQDGYNKVWGLVQRGTFPQGIDFTIARSLEGLSRGEDPKSGPYHVSAGASSASLSAVQFQARPGEFLVFDSIAFEGAQSITGYVDRDSNESYLQWSGAAFAQTNPDSAWDHFIPAVNTLNFRFSASGATTGTVRIRVMRYRLSDAWKVRLGLAHSQADLGNKDARTYAEVLAGIA